jgi:hypothetical protein
MKTGFLTRTRISILAGLAFCLALIAWQWERVYPYAALILPLDAAPAKTIPELTLETTIPLGIVKGRIDHLAFDPGRKRLFVAELGNNTVAVADIQNKRLETRLTGFNEPQGIGFVTAARHVPEIASAGFEGSSIMIKPAPRPVRTPPVEVANR